MHLIFVTSLVPDGEPGTGYEIASAAIIAALRRAGARVTILGYSWPGRPPSDPENTVSLGEINVRTEGAPALQKAKWLAEALMSGVTFASAKLRATNEADVRSALQRVGPFDAYVINGVQLVGAFETLFSDKPSIFIAHNVEHRSAAENAEAVQDIVQRILFTREARLLRQIEARLCHRSSFTFTLAEEDRAALGVASEDRSAALPLVTRPFVEEMLASREIACDAALIGTWSWQPNRIGLEWFLREVTPWLPRNFRTQVAGHIPAGLKAPYGVEFIGRVEDAKAFVRGAAVLPLIAQAGTGVQLKTIEAFELGLPCIATSRSLRGISYLPANCRVVDDPSAFAAALAEAASERMPDVDGLQFHQAQLRALDEKIVLGLSKLASTRGKAAA